jgi:biotin carboxyl carrier protein
MSSPSPSATLRTLASRPLRKRSLAAVLVVGLGAAGITAVLVDRTGSDVATTTAPTIPALGSTVEPEFIAVRRQALTSTLQLRARTATGEIEVATPEGMATTMLVSAGSHVVAGQPVARFDPPAQSLADAQRKVEDGRLALRQALAEADAPEGSATATFAVEQARLATDRAEADLKVLRNSASVVEAPDDGTLVQLPSGALAVTTGRVVDAELRPLQLLRLRSGALSGTANVETVTGLRTVPCLGITLTEGQGRGDAGNVGGTDAEVAGVASCALEDGVETVDGLNATIEVKISLGDDVLVIPNSAVAHDDAGAALVLRRAGEQVERVTISMGASDGVLRVVGEGLDEGDEVQLEPSAEGQP